MQNDFLSFQDSLIGLEPEVIHLCLEEGIYLVLSTEKLKIDFCVKTNWLLKTCWSFCLHERFLPDTHALYWYCPTCTPWRNALSWGGEVSETGKSHRQVEFVCFSPSCVKQEWLSLSLSFTSYLVSFARQHLRLWAFPEPFLSISLGYGSSRKTGPI